MGFALALAWENKRLILGESLPRDEEQRLREVVDGWAGVDRVVDLRSVYFGPEQVVVTADVEFAPGLDGAELDERITAIKDALREADEGIQKVYVEPEV